MNTINRFTFHLLLALLAITPVLAQNQPVCSFTQVTRTTGANDLSPPKISADGVRMVFTAAADLVGRNADGNTEVFLYDANTGVFTQVTDTTGVSNNSDAVISADGTRVAFRSDANLASGEIGFGSKVFLYDIVSGVLTRITPPNEYSQEPSLSANGKRIAFRSTANLTGGNPDGSVEIFLYDLATSGFIQVTSSIRNSFSPTLSADGRQIAFVSEGDLTGANPDLNKEIFLYNDATKTTAQVTVTAAGDSLLPAIAADGSRIAFRSNANLTGGNPDQNWTIFIYDTASLFFQQVTSTEGTVLRPSLTATGKRIAFISNADLTGDNGDNRFEVFVYNTESKTFTQITTEAGVTGDRVSLTADGKRIAFVARTNLTGDNVDGNTEIFLADCAPQVKLQINGQGGSFKVPEGELVALEALIDPVSWDSTETEWWIFATTPYGALWFDLTSGDWVESATAIAAYSGPLFAFDAIIYESGNLLKGPYGIYFGLDQNMNGQPDWDTMNLTSLAGIIY